MKQFITLAALALVSATSGCARTKIPGVMDSKNFFFNQKFTKLDAGATQGTNPYVRVEGFVSDATENFRVFSESMVKIAEAFASGGATGLIPSAQPVMLMTPVGFGAESPSGPVGGTPDQPHQTGFQPLYLVPVGRPAIHGIKPNTQTDPQAPPPLKPTP